MPLAVAKLSKLALSKGSKFMLASMAALQPPTSFGAGEYPSFSDVSLSFTWSPPTTGPVPDAYRFEFVTDSLGTIQLTGSDTLAVIDGVPFDAYWTANVWSRLGEQESEYSAFTYGTTSSGSYP